MFVKDAVKVVVSGAGGRMGREVISAVLESKAEMTLVGAVDPAFAGQPVSELLHVDCPVIIARDLASTLGSTPADVVVIFTVPCAAMESIRASMEAKAVPLVGTTGISEQDVAEIRQLAARHGVGAIIAPNFAVGAALMMKLACQAAKYFPSVEIVELHHDKKLDAPSGTAILTAKLLAASREESAGRSPEASVPCRGGDFHGIQVHSVRLPGLVAHQEIIFGGLGQTLTLRHDSLDRKSFMPGVLLAIKKSRGLEEVVWGLENII